MFVISRFDIAEIILPLQISMETHDTGLKWRLQSKSSAALRCLTVANTSFCV